MNYETFTDAHKELRVRMLDEADIVHSKRWQGADIANNPNMVCYELTHEHLKLDLQGIESLAHWQQDIQPDLPWADDHFEERVCGLPINPGTHWANWSHNAKAGAEHFLEEGKFNHNYMERYWPRFAGHVPAATPTPSDWRRLFKDSILPGVPPSPNRGIKYEYGDLLDVLALLRDDPYTRQAYLPVWFPEDTGGGSKRTPCTIGYHFLMRSERLDINYHIRSCDFHKHFRNDLYFTVRLLIWALEKLRSSDPAWRDVHPGTFVMQIGSLHVFRTDWDKL